MIQTKRIQIYFLEYSRLQKIIIETNFDDSSSLLEQYKEFEDVFSEEKTAKLSNRTSYDHAIETKRKMFFFESIYNMSIIELETLRKYINENLAKKFIVKSISSTKISILFVKKSNEELCLCVNYRELNVIIIKNKYFLFRVEILLNRMHDVKVFIKIDII